MKYNELEVNTFIEPVEQLPHDTGKIFIDVNADSAWEKASAVVVAKDLNHNRDILAAHIKAVPSSPIDYVLFEDIYMDNRYYYDLSNSYLYQYIEDRTKNVWGKLPYQLMGVEGDPTKQITEISSFDDRLYYYDNTIDNPVLMKYSKASRLWTEIAPLILLEVDPYTEYDYIIEDILVDSIYYNKTTGEAFQFNYKEYWVRIQYEGSIDLPIYDFYRKMYNMYIDINSTVRVPANEVYVCWGEPENKIARPEKSRVYYDGLGNEYYLFDGNIFIKLLQDVKLIPFGLFY